MVGANAGVGIAARPVCYCEARVSAKAGLGGVDTYEKSLVGSCIRLRSEANDCCGDLSTVMLARMVSADYNFTSPPSGWRSDMAVDIKGMTPLLQVFDMATSLKFYCDVLGFQIVTTDANTTAPNHNWVWLRLNQTDLMLNTAYEYGKRPLSPDPRRVASHRDTTLYFGAPDVDAVYADLHAKGIDLKEPKVASYGMKQLFLRDPDGFEMCFQWEANR